MLPTPGLPSSLFCTPSPPQMLLDMINNVARDLLLVLQVLPRLALQLTDKQRREMEVR